MAPLCRRLVFTSLPRQPHKWGKTFSAVLLWWPWQWKFGAKRQSGDGRAEASLWLVSSEPQLKHFNQPLGSVRGWGGAKSVLGTKTLERKQDDQKQGCNNNEKCKQDDQYARRHAELFGKWQRRAEASILNNADHRMQKRALAKTKKCLERKNFACKKRVILKKRLKHQNKLM